MEWERSFMWNGVDRYECACANSGLFDILFGRKIYIFMRKYPFLLCCSDTKCVAGAVSNFDNACLKASKTRCILVFQLKDMMKNTFSFCLTKQNLFKVNLHEACCLDSDFTFCRKYRKKKSALTKKKKINEFVCWRLCNVFSFRTLNVTDFEDGLFCGHTRFYGTYIF